MTDEKIKRAPIVDKISEIGGAKVELKKAYKALFQKHFHNK